MTFRGHVQGNVVILDAPTGLPDGAPVIVEPVSEAEPQGKSLLDHLGNLVGSIEGLPEDFAENHDHYIHGAPRK